MIDAKRLREQATSKQSVAAIWNKAVESARDAEIAELSMDGALQAAYNAGHLAALALLAAHGCGREVGKVIMKRRLPAQRLLAGWDSRILCRIPRRSEGCAKDRYMIQ